MANITYTITQDGEEISYTINDGVGPVGPAGPNNITTATETDITGILKGDGANVSAAVEDTDYQGVPAEGAFIDGDKTKLDGIEAGADVTDAANVDAAGAVMESDYSPAHSVLAQQSGTGSPSSVTLGTNSLLGRASGAGTAIQGLTAAQARTLLNVEDGATADQTAAEILTAIKTVDGTGSGLDADLLDGQEASAFAAASHTHTASDLDFAGSTDIGADLADADEVLVSDGGGNTTRVKSALSRFWTYIKAKIESVGLSSLNITGDLTVDTDTLQVNSTTNEVTIAQDLYSQGPILVVNGFSGFDGGLSTFSVNAGTWNGSIITGNQSFSGQIELTGQAASTDDSAMTRSLSDLRHKRGDTSWYGDDGIWAATTSGSGSTVKDEGYLYVATGTTTGSIAQFRNAFSQPWVVCNTGNSATSTGLDFGQEWVFRFRGYYSGFTNVKRYFMFGALRTDTAATQPTTKSCGFEVDAGSLYAFVHNGSTYTKSSSAILDVSTANVMHEYLMRCDGTNIEFYVDGSLLDTLTAPSGFTAANGTAFRISVDNTTGTTNADMRIMCPIDWYDLNQ